jgi:hypothetical protein
MRWFSGGTHRFRPVIVSLFFLVIPLFVLCPAGASSCGLSEQACPVCPAGGLALNDSSAYDHNYPDTLDSPGVFAGLTCNYGNPLSGNTVTVKIDCYKDAGVAQKWYQYYRREIPYPFPETGYGSANQYSEHTRGHRVMPVAYWGTGPKPAYTFKSAYADWDYALAGRYEAEIESLTPTDTITQNEASAKNVERIKQFSSCFASFQPGGVPAPQQQVIKGTIRGSRPTKEYFADLKEAMYDYVYGLSADKALAFRERLEAGGYAKYPVRHVKVIWKGSTAAGAQDREYTTSTDKDGNFEIPAAPEPGKQYQFDIEFTYRKADTDYFSISEAGVYNKATYSHVFEYTGPQDLRQDVHILAELEKADVDKEYLAGMTSTLLLYDETANAFEFYTDHLGENLDCNLPLSIYPFWPDRRSKFEIDSGRGNGTPSPAIVLKPDDSTFDNPFHSQYIVYHEFSHYAMYCLYGKKFPESPADKAGAVKTINHGGYMNPSTSDSFTEGFADFMPAVMAEHYGSPFAGEGSGMGSIEDEFEAWDFAGEGEEYAVSSTLWSLYDTDSHYERERKSREKELRDILSDPAKVAFEADLKGITAGEYRAQVTREIGLLQSGNNIFLSENPVRLRFDELWPVLRTYQQDFAGVHDSLVSRYPAKKAAIDTVFVNHGFYRDTNRGNGSYDPLEPFRPASGDRKTWAAGDPFTDYPTGGFRYTGTETVGPAGDYQRITRRSTEPLPGHFIKTPVDVPVYVVSVEYEDRPWKSYRTLVSGTDAMVPIPVPPPAEKAGITVVPVGVKYERPLFFRSEDFNRDFAAAASRGYYREHDFKVSGPIPARTVVKAGGTPGAGTGALLSLLLKPDGPLAYGLPGPWSRIPLYLSLPAVLVGLALLVWRLREE